MIDPYVFPRGELEKLFKLLKHRAPGLLPSCRWLVLGPGIAEIVLDEHAEEPTLVQLLALARRVQSYSARLLPVVYELLASSPLASSAIVELDLDRLLERSDWQHPTQVLESPRPDFRQLLEASRARLRVTPPDRRQAVEAVVAKLERALRIDEEARRKRQQMRRRKRPPAR